MFYIRDEIQTEGERIGESRRKFLVGFTCKRKEKEYYWNIFEEVFSFLRLK